MKGINRSALVFSRVLEVLHWILAAVMAVVSVGAATDGGWLSSLIKTILPEGGVELSTYGFEVLVADSAGNINMTTVFLFSIGAVIIISLMAMSFRNVHLILRKTKDSTPFQKDNIRMLREIGIFNIAVPIVGIIMSIIIRAVIGVDDVEASVQMSGLVTGVLILCLTQFFAYGMELENDVGGLL